MDSELYRKIIIKIHNFPGLTKDCLRILQQEYPNLHAGTLASIVSQEYQKQIKQSNYKNTTAHENLYNKYKELKKISKKPGVIVDFATEYGLAPTLAARLILKQYCEESCTDEEDNSTKSSKRSINSLLKDTTLIEDKDLAYEIFLCSLLDDQYSPVAETIKHTVGQQYEIRLHRHLDKLGLAFKDEESLRKYGYDKTPDIKLEVPVAVNGLIINWIESKALFGDEENHRTYMKDQYLSYWNRFGPGLVIYWFGYLETIKDPSDKRILIMDNMPENITFFNHSQTETVY